MSRATLPQNINELINEVNSNLKVDPVLKIDATLNDSLDPF